MKSPSKKTAENAGPDIRILRKIWKKLVMTETQLELISRMVELNIGFPDIEEFIGTQNGKLKSSKFTSKFKLNKVMTNQVNNLMKSKLTDAVESHREAKKVKDCKRNELELLYGKKL